MKSRHLGTHWFNRMLTSVVILLLVLSPIATALAPRQASAQLPVTDAASVKSAISNAGTWVESKASAIFNSLSAASLKSLDLKEWVLDGVLFALAKKALSSMVRSTIAWVNSGFKGSPMYVTDPGQYFTNIADEIAGEVIYGSELNFLCSPMSIRVALEFYYKQSKSRRVAQCTLSSAVRNVKQFTQGNFMAGGWPGWLSVAVTPSNQPMNAALAAKASLDMQIAGGVSTAQTKLNWGGGFLSHEVCPTPGSKVGCKIVTPGTVISDALKFDLSIGSRTLIEADEINELIGALFAQLGNQALTSLKGLSGMSESGNAVGARGGGLYGGGSSCASLSYLDQMNDPACNPSVAVIVATTSDLIYDAEFIASALTDERAYQAMQREVISRASSTIALAVDLGAGCNGNLVPKSDAESILEEAEENVGVSKDNVIDLLALQRMNDRGGGTSTLAAIDQYIDLIGAGTLHTSITNVRERIRIDDVKDDITAIRATIVPCPPPPIKGGTADPASTNTTPDNTYTGGS